MFARAIAGHTKDFMAGPDLSKVRVEAKDRTATEPVAFPVSVEQLGRRAIGAEILDRVCTAFRLSHAAVARHWDCSESHVRSVRLGEKPLTVENILALPKDAALAYLEQLKEEIERAANEGTSAQELAACAVALGEAFHAHQLGDPTGLEKAAVKLKSAADGLVLSTQRGAK